MLTLVKHKVEIASDGEYAIACPTHLEVKVGETLQIRTPEKAFRTVFEPWPFKETKKHVTSSDDQLTFEREGQFDFYCYVTPKNQNKELQYRTGAGGNGNVHPPG